MAADPVTELMERVLRQSGGGYLSDLHDVGRAVLVQKAVRHIPVDDYAVDTWSALAGYIMQEKPQGETSEQVIAALLAYLRETV